MAAERQSRNLDVLRAIAVSAVFLGHLSLTFSGDNFVFGSAARFGVMAFFVHTALVLMQSLERLDSDGGGSLATRFYVRRLFRIYPLAMVCVVLVATIGIPRVSWKPFVVPPTGRVVASNLLLVQNLTGAPDIIAPLWSLPFEVQMYLALPLCYWAVRRWNWNPFLLWLGAVVACAPFFPTRFASVIAYVPCFLAGVMAYRFGKSSRTRLAFGFLIVLLLLDCALYTAARTYLRTDSLERANSWTYTLAVTDWLSSLAIGLSLSYFVEIRNGWISRAAHQIAKYSYGVYLSHMPVMWFTRIAMARQPAALRLLVFVVGVVGIPVLAFHLLESPAIRFGKRVSNRFRGSPKIAVSQAA